MRHFGIHPNELRIFSTEMKNKFELFTEIQLQEIVALEMPWANNKLSRYEYIMHVINHSTYHRRQIVTMARSLEVIDGIANTDYNIFNSK